jgi:hypothetical protein
MSEKIKLGFVGWFGLALMLLGILFFGAGVFELLTVGIFALIDRENGAVKTCRFWGWFNIAIAALLFIFLIFGVLAGGK